MDITTTRSWKEDFARSAAFRREQDRFFRETEKRIKEKVEDAKADDAVSDLAGAMVLASESDIAAFRSDLDGYRTAATEALIENERQLALVQAELDDMLGKAYVLPDGRRVFKTEDGLRVFDENGVELSAKDIDPDVIEDWRPRAEGYLERRDDKLDLVTEHDKIITFEERVELADERAKSGEMTEGELSDLRGDLEASIPLSVRSKLPGHDALDAADPVSEPSAVPTSAPATAFKPG
ncbi:MAG: hypothetical protein AB7P20_19335 [Rhizobiaceae bacterium]